MNQMSFAGPYGVELAGPYGVELAAAGDTKTLGLYTWQWLFVAGAGALTATGSYVAAKNSKVKKPGKTVAIGGLGGLLGGALFAYALGKA